VLKVVFNGALMAASEAMVSPLAAGFSHGFGVFETLRAQGGCVLFRDDHLDRLRASCEALDLGPLAGREALADQLAEVLAANGLMDCVLKVHVARAGVGVDTVVFVRDPVAPARHPQNGVRVLLDRDVAPSKWVAGHKCANYLRNLLARAHAQSEGCEEALFVDPTGRVCEGAGTNVFWVRDGVVFTPSLDCAILPGVMRKQVVARQSVAPVREGVFSLADLEAAQEVFLTNAVRGVVPVCAIDGTSVALARQAGPVTRAIQDAMRSLERG